mgnify:CR=1 FL=1
MKLQEMAGGIVGAVIGIGLSTMIGRAIEPAKPAATHLPPVGAMAPPMMGTLTEGLDGTVRLTYTFESPAAFREWITSGRGEGACVKEAADRRGLTIADMMRLARTKVDE